MRGSGYAATSRGKQIPKQKRAWDLESPPDRWVDAEERDFEFVERWLGFCRGHEALLSNTKRMADQRQLSPSLSLGMLSELTFSGIAVGSESLRESNRASYPGRFLKPWCSSQGARFWRLYPMNRGRLQAKGAAHASKDQRNPTVTEFLYQFSVGQRRQQTYLLLVEDESLSKRLAISIGAFDSCGHHLATIRDHDAARGLARATSFLALFG